MLQDDKKLEYHVPKSFDEKRPGFTYSHVEYAVKITEHPIASKIPRATSRPSVVGDLAEFQPLTRADTPASLDDFLYSDLPQLSVKIISFEDATLVSLTWPHTFLDAMGRVALFKNWIAVLEGREDDVQPLHGYDTDPLATLGTRPTEPSLLAKWQLSGISLFLFVIRYLFDLLWYSKEETRVVCVPGRVVQDLRQKALEDLTKEYDQKGDTKPFVSDGDVICAWWTRTLISALRPSPNRTIVIMNAFGMRNTLSKDFLPAGSAYVSNAAINVLAFIPVADLLSKPLSYVASKVRESITQQGTRAQVEAFTYNFRECVQKAGRAPVYGDSSMLLVIFSNWSSGKFFDIDFSSAVIKQGLPSDQRSNALGRPSYVNADGKIRGFFGRNAFPILGRDAAGNYWLTGPARAEAWPEIEKSLAAL